GVAPQPHALRGFPFGLAYIKPLRFRALAPIDALRSVARLILAELPEGLALADAAAAMHALRDRRGDAVGGDKQWRQRSGRLFGTMLKDPGFRHQRSGSSSRSMTWLSETPSARAAKVSAMR